MQEVIQAIQELATPRLYDWLVLAVAGVAIVVSGLAAFYAYKLNKKQSEILEQQNKIALFETRYKLFLFFDLFCANIRGLVIGKDCDSINKANSYKEYRAKIKILTIRFRKINAYHYIDTSFNGSAYQHFVQEVSYMLDQFGAIEYSFNLSKDDRIKIKDIEKNIIKFKTSE